MSASHRLNPPPKYRRSSTALNSPVHDLPVASGVSQNRTCCSGPVSGRTIWRYTDKMHRVLFITIVALGTTGCSDRNLVGEQVWPDERLAQAKVGFGWNYEVESDEAPSRNIDVAIQPNNSFEIQISEYGSEAGLENLSRAEGSLAPADVTRLRRSLAQLRSGNGADLFTSLPNCPKRSHPAIEYYVGFEIAQERTVTVIERSCETPETLEGRKIISEAMAAFPQVDRTKLVAGSLDL